MIFDGVELFLQERVPHNDGEYQLIVGNNVGIGRDTCIGSDYGIVIEDNVQIAPRCHLTDRNHVYADTSLPIVA